MAARWTGCAPSQNTARLCLQGSQFKCAAGATSACKTVLYIIMGSTGHRLGSVFDFSYAVTCILPHDAGSVLMNAGVLVHCFFACQIILDVWADMVLHILVPHSSDSVS